LGMIRHFQEMYFHCNYVQTTPKGGYTVPDFCAVATAYGIRSRKIQSLAEVEQITFGEDGPECIEVLLPDETYVTPKLVFGQPNQDQDPPIDRDLYRELMEL
jgi:acetolactate synthase I/II/III large subunit